MLSRHVEFLDSAPEDFHGLCIKVQTVYLLDRI